MNKNNSKISERLANTIFFLLFLNFIYFCGAAKIEAQISPDDLIHTGDVVEIGVVGNYDYDWRGSLSPEGYFNQLNFVENPIYGVCQNPEDIARQIEKEYAKLLKNPQVSVKIIDRSKRPVAEMFGAVKKSQRFQIRRAVNLNELIVLSGGLTDYASGEIQILRPSELSCAPKSDSGDEKTQSKEKGQPQNIKIKVSDLLKGLPQANPRIYNGDLITILTAEPVYIIGGVRNPKQIPLREKTSVTRAIESAGGISREGREDAISLFRREDNQTKVYNLDLTKIKSGAAEDMQLKPFDIIEVEQKGAVKRRFPPTIDNRTAEIKTFFAPPLIVIE